MSIQTQILTGLSLFEVVQYGAIALPPFPTSVSPEIEGAIVFTCLLTGHPISMLRAVLAHSAVVRSN